MMLWYLTGCGLRQCCIYTAAATGAELLACHLGLGALAALLVARVVYAHSEGILQSSDPPKKMVTFLSRKALMAAAVCRPPACNRSNLPPHRRANDCSDSWWPQVLRRRKWLHRSRCIDLLLDAISTRPRVARVGVGDDWPHPVEIHCMRHATKEEFDVPPSG